MPSNCMRQMKQQFSRVKQLGQDLPFALRYQLQLSGKHWRASLPPVAVLLRASSASSPPVYYFVLLNMQIPRMTDKRTGMHRPLILSDITRVILNFKRHWGKTTHQTRHTGSSFVIYIFHLQVNPLKICQHA